MPNLDQFLLAVPVLLFSMVAHEYAHGYAALRQGDPTAYQLGRLTWNPLKHIDPFLTILMPIMTWWGSGGTFLFGGAKPVPVMPQHYRNYRRGDIIVSLAGIAVNLVLFVICSLLLVAFGFIGSRIEATGNTMGLLQRMMFWGIQFNLILAVFNLLPLPPLDGSHVAKYLMPASWALRYQQFGRYGILVLLLLFVTDVGQRFFAFWMTPVMVLGGQAIGFAAPFILRSAVSQGGL